MTISICTLTGLIGTVMVINSIDAAAQGIESARKLYCLGATIVILSLIVAVTA